MLETLRIGHIVYDNLAWLDPEIVKAADEAMALYSSHRFDSAIARGGAAIELLCRQIIESGLKNRFAPVAMRSDA